MTGSAIFHMVCEGRRDFLGVKSIGVFEIRYSEFGILSSILCQLPAEFLCAMPIMQLTTDNGLLTGCY